MNMQPYKIYNQYTCHCLSIQCRPAAVSYTHLDVYTSTEIKVIDGEMSSGSAETESSVATIAAVLSCASADGVVANENTTTKSSTMHACNIVSLKNIRCFMMIEELNGL